MATNVKIIRHKNPNGRTTWYRAVYYDEKGRVSTNPRVIVVEIVVGQDVPRKIGYMPTSIYGVRLRTLNNE